MPNGTPSNKQVETITHFVRGRDVHDLGAGDCVLSGMLVTCGATHVTAVDKNLPTPELARRRVPSKVSLEQVRFEDYRPAKPIDVAFVSWPVNRTETYLEALVRDARIVIYLGSNTDSNACGGQYLLEQFLNRDLLGCIPARQNTLLVLGDSRAEPRLPTGDEVAGIAGARGGRVFTYEEGLAITKHNYGYSEWKGPGAAQARAPRTTAVWVHPANRPLPCTVCGQMIECALRAGDEEHAPRPGDCVFCGKCYEPHVITDTFGYRLMTAAERAEAPEEFHAMMANAALRRGERPS